VFTKYLKGKSASFFLRVKASAFARASTTADKSADTAGFGPVNDFAAAIDGIRRNRNAGYSPLD